MSKIVIGVACHKPSELPHNSIYLPIHVGAALAAKPLPGLQPDSEGDNISEKNPSYCELTAQYWLWKNADADYYGLSHYRRFMSFAPETFDNFTLDRRKQVLIGSLNDHTQRIYHLDDEDGMRELIEGYDVVATENQDLRHVYTPRGYKSTVYDHFAAHDGDLINTEDLDRMLAIVAEDFPQYYDDLMEYLKKPYFRGFNCFVMRKDLFFELCEFEFGVLEKLEDQVDLSQYDVTRSRIYGFMAEILYSGFVYHLQKSGRARVKDVQMLFFEDTEVKRFEPVPDATPICFLANSKEPFMVDIALESLIRHANPAKRYDVIILHLEEMTSFYLGYYRDKVKEHPNITVRFKDWDVISDSITDVEDQVFDAPQLYMPWIFPSYDKMLVISQYAIFHDDCSALNEADLAGQPIGAVKSIRVIGKANGTYDQERKYLLDDLGLKTIFDYFDSSLMLMNLAAMRGQGYCVADFTQKIAAAKFKKKRLHPSEEMLNVAFEGSVCFLDQYWNYQPVNDLDQVKEVQDVPVELFREYQKAKGNNALLTYQSTDPWWPEGEAFEIEFWNYAKESDLFPFFLSEVAKAWRKPKKNSYRASDSRAQSTFNKLFPRGTGMRELVLRVLPPGSRRHRAALKVYKAIS